MTEFLRITDDAMAALPWQIVVRCAGIDFETGGTMSITVHHDPGLTEENMVQEADLAEVARRMNLPTVLNMQPVKSVYSSSRSRQILYLRFSSQAHEQTMVWHLTRDTSEFASKIRELPRTVDLDVEPFRLVSEIFQSLSLLKCWRELNAYRFASYQLTIDPDLEVLLPGLNSAGASASGSGFVIGAGHVLHDGLPP